MTTHRIADDNNNVKRSGDGDFTPLQGAHGQDVMKILRVPLEGTQDKILMNIKTIFGHTTCIAKRGNAYTEKIKKN